MGNNTDKEHPTAQLIEKVDMFPFVNMQILSETVKYGKIKLLTAALVSEARNKQKEVSI